MAHGESQRGICAHPHLPVFVGEAAGFVPIRVDVEDEGTTVASVFEEGREVHVAA